MTKAALYCRVSRDDLNNANQLQILQARAQNEGWEYEVFQEQQSSRKTRPIKQALIQRLRKGDFDILCFTRLDRFARSLSELVADIEQLVGAGIRVVVVQQGFDFSRSGGFGSIDRLTLQIMGAFSEFEREIIRERTIEGLARVKAQGKKLGRPRKTPSVNPGLKQDAAPLVEITPDL